MTQSQMTQSQFQSAPPSAPPQQLNVADVETQLTGIYDLLVTSQDTAGVTEFRRLSVEFKGWRGDVVRANGFLASVRPLAPHPAQEAEQDPWDLSTPVAAVEEHVLPLPVAEPVQEEAQHELSEPQAEAITEPNSEGADLGNGPVSEPSGSGAELQIITARPESDPGNLFAQLRALYERGTGSGWRIMGSFLPDGRQRLVFIDENVSGLRTFTLDGTDAELDTELAPLLATHLGDPAHEVRTLAAQLAGAAKAQVQATRKPAAPVSASRPAATKTATKPSVPATPRTGMVNVTLEPAAAASGTYDGPARGKLKFESGRASLAALLPGEYTVRVSADGYLETEEKISVRAGDQQEVTLHLTSAGLDF